MPFSIPSANRNLKENTGSLKERRGCYVVAVQPVSRRDVLALTGFLAACSRTRQNDLLYVGGPRRRVSDVLSPAHLGDVRLSGYLGAKLDACIANRIFAQDPGALVAP